MTKTKNRLVTEVIVTAIVILMVVVIMFVVTMFVVIMFVVITCTSQHCRVSWNTESFAPIEQYRLLYRKAPVIVESFMK